jgi:hypothetical protein
MNMRACIRGWLSGVVIILGFTPLLAAASTDNGTLTVGAGSVGSCGIISDGTAVIGYYSIDSLGSYSPTALTGGTTLLGIYDVFSLLGCPDSGNILVSGFSSNPGSGWLTSVTCDGVTNLASSASTFIYTASKGTALWAWSQRFGFRGTSPFSCSVVHN